MVDAENQLEAARTRCEIQLIHADALEWLRSQPADSVDLIFGGPPYAMKGARYGTSSKRWPTGSTGWPTVRLLRTA